MDGVNINKYLGQFNPILIVPVLSAVIGAILVFVFGFRKPNEPKFVTGPSTDSLKRSKKKTNGTKQQDAAQQATKVQNAQSTKVNKKVVSIETVAPKKVVASVANEKSIGKKKDEKKTEEKRSENGSPAKKVTPAAKKTIKESPPAVSATTVKKQKTNKKTVAEEREQKPADFDDGGWFTVQSKGTKKVNKSDETSAKSTTDSASPTQAISKNKSKSAKLVEKIVEKKTVESTLLVAETEGAVIVAEQIEPKEKILVEEILIVTDAIAETVPVVVSPPVVPAVIVEDVIVVAAKPVAAAPKEIVAVAVSVPVEDSNVAFDELGEWTDAKPDRKRGNKKKSRKD